MEATNTHKKPLAALRKVRSAESSSLDLRTTQWVHNSLQRATTTPKPYQNSCLLIHDTRQSDETPPLIQPCTNSEIIALLGRVRYLLLNDIVYAAYATAGLESHKVKDILENQWPLIVISEPDADSANVGDGWHVRKVGKENSIYIDAGLANFFEVANLEEKKYLTLFLFAVVTHELAHYIGTMIFGLSYDTPEKIFSRQIRKGEAGEKVEEAVFGGVIMADRKNQYKPVLVDYDDQYEELDVERLVERFWNEDIKVPFIGEEDILNPEAEGKSRIRGTFARLKGYERVMELVRRMSRKRKAKKITTSFTGPGKDHRDVLR